MTEPHPLMALLLENSSFVGPAETVENEIEPLPEQFSLTIGDAALVASADTPLESDFVVVRVVDPVNHAERYPDWEERVGINAHLLCQYFSRMDPVHSLGWFSRLKLIPITNYRYRQCRVWLKEGFPDEIPDWSIEVFRNFADKLSERAPGLVPHSVPCERCGSREVDLIVRRRIAYNAKAGTIVRDGKTLHLPINDVEEDSTHTARLECTKCHSYAELEDEEWELPDISN